MFARAADENPVIRAALADAILYKIDCEKGEGVELAERYDVRGYPTFKMVDARGRELERWIGYDGPEAWADLVAAGVRDRRTLEAKAKAYAAEPTAVLARSLGNAAATVYDWKGAVEHFRAARDLDPEHAGAYEDAIVGYTAYGTRGEDPAFTLADLEAAARPVFDREDKTPAEKLELAALIGYFARGAGEPEMAVPYIRDAMAASEGVEDEAVAGLRARLAVPHALLVEKDAAKAVALKKEALPEGWRDDPAQLNSFAWWCFENGVNLQEAEELALRGVELAESDQQRATILDTAAEICAELGDCDEAVARIERAVALDPDNEYYREQLARFQEASRQQAQQEG